MPTDDLPRFHHAERGMTRFPPNVESIGVERQGVRVWLTARRNDVELRFPLAAVDLDHLLALLRAARAEVAEDLRLLARS